MGVTWLPRIGLAYQITPTRPSCAPATASSTAPSASFKTTANLPGFSQSTPIEATNDNGLTFKTTLANPLPDGPARSRSARPAG